MSINRLFPLQAQDKPLAPSLHPKHRGSDLRSRRSRQQEPSRRVQILKPLRPLQHRHERLAPSLLAHPYDLHPLGLLGGKQVHPDAREVRSLERPFGDDGRGGIVGRAESFEQSEEADGGLVVEESGVDLADLEGAGVQLLLGVALEGERTCTRARTCSGSNWTFP